MTTTAPRPTAKQRKIDAKLARVRAEAAAAARRQRNRRIARIVGLLVVIGLVSYGLLSSRQQSSAEARLATDFTLPTTDGGSVTLSELRGSPVVLYFNEGAGCASCTVQMAEIEKEPGFAEAGITVLPIVMNTAEQILPDMARYGATTPYLLDDGKVSDAYGTLGTGMHEGLPGHGFVLVDADGVQRWQGDYPSMWLEPSKLLEEVTSRL
ncbi:peroxiredoxin family protein [Georgenia yuyongxinii]|uniref:Peroxiredoxin family protein n=1 Tax=Georgenia yuyongxinii TaxID=2589797 RepID=A0A552WSU8_9MICO|nr:peroxiredoxin family protein [Georgenia yuyongxinii]TRW45746.1 peroxiredoxin family protein [Georgenia yuyongxinii]